MPPALQKPATLPHDEYDRRYVQRLLTTAPLVRTPQHPQSTTPPPAVLNASTSKLHHQHVALHGRQLLREALKPRAVLLQQRAGQVHVAPASRPRGADAAWARRGGPCRGGVAAAAWSPHTRPRPQSQPRPQQPRPWTADTGERAGDRCSPRQCLGGGEGGQLLPHALQLRGSTGSHKVPWVWEVLNNMQGPTEGLRLGEESASGRRRNQYCTMVTAPTAHTAASHCSSAQRWACAGRCRYRGASN